jgi:hypothetical protein
MNRNMHHDHPGFSLRDGLVGLFHDNPAMAFELLARARGVPFPADQLTIRSEATEFPDPRDPAKVHRTDAVFVAYAEVFGVETAIDAVALEVLLDKDPRRCEGWPIYPEAIRERHGCPAQVIVLSPDPEVQRWANAQARGSSPGLRFS